MVLTLVVLKLTYRALSAADFLIFNSVLFALGLASGCFAPSLRALWKYGDVSTAARAGLVNVGISVAVVTAFLVSNRTLLTTHDVDVVALATGAAALYCGAKAVERMIYAYGFMKHEFRLAFGASSLFIIFELAVVIPARFRSSLVLRLLGPAALFLISCWQYGRLRGAAKGFRIARFLTATRAFFRAEYISRTGLLTLAYTVLFGITAMIERVYPTFVPANSMVQDAGAFKDYLLVLAYAVAFQSVVSIAVDWARPLIINESVVQRRARDQALFTAAWIVVAGISACTLGFWLFHFLNLIPESVPITLWSLILLRGTAAVLIFLAQVDLVIAGRVARACIPWLAIILTEIVLIGGNLSIENLRHTLSVTASGMLAVAGCELFLLTRRLRVARQ